MHRPVSVEVMPNERHPAHLDRQLVVPVKALLAAGHHSLREGVVADNWPASLIASTTGQKADAAGNRRGIHVEQDQRRLKAGSFPLSCVDATCQLSS